MTELEQRIIELAQQDPAAFLRLAGEAAITRMKVCLLLREGKSQMQVARRMKISKWQVQRKKCAAC